MMIIQFCLNETDFIVNSELTEKDFFNFLFFFMYKNELLLI